MHQLFNPEKNREAVTRALHLVLNDSIGPRWNGMGEQLAHLMESVGAWDAYQCEWENFGKGPKWSEVLAALVNDQEGLAIEQLRETVRASRKSIESRIAKQRSSTTGVPDANSSRDASVVIKDRMRIELMAHGWGVAVRESALISPKPRGETRGAASYPRGRRPDMDEDRWRDAYEQCLDEICLYDEELRRGQMMIARAPLSELREIRSLFFGKRVLPWWLDGRVELMAMARTHPDAWQLCEATLREGYLTDRLVTQIMMHIGGSGNPVGTPVKTRYRGDLCRVYSWEIESDDREACRIELLTPANRSGRRIKLQLRTRDGTRPAESSWLMGRMMMLNGLMLHWTRTCRDSVVSAELPSRGNPLPKKGTFVLVDLYTQRVLEPVESVAYRDE